MSNFARCLERTLVHEGKWSDHPNDPGGATMYGVIQRVYDGYRRRKGQPTQTVRLISGEELQDIYQTQYWNAIRGDDLPRGVDLAVFDGAVNSGPGQSAKWLQRALGVQADGDIGGATLKAAHEVNPVALVAALCEQRMSFLRSLRHWSTFGKGWTNRVNDIRRVGLLWAKNAEAPRSEPPPAEMVIPERAAPSQIKVTRTVEGAGGAIATTGGAGATIAEAAEKLSPFTDYSNVLKYAFIALLIVGLGITIYGIYKRRQEGALA